MRNPQVARNYAEALFALGREAEALDRIERDFQTIVEAARQTELERVLDHPLIAKGEVLALLDGAFSGAHPYLLNLVKLLAVRGRGSYLADIYREYVKLRDRTSRRLRATVYTPFELEEGDGLAEEIRRRLERLSGRQVQLSVVYDETITGGIRLKVHDLVLDGTVEARLEALRAHLQGEDEGREGGRGKERERGR